LPKLGALPHTTQILDILCSPLVEKTGRLNAIVCLKGGPAAKRGA
jgi:hypothetical protein